MEFFRGFVATKNKKCTQKFKNVPSEELLTQAEADALPGYAGILSEDAILIDVDDKKQSDLLYKLIEGQDLVCRVYQTTRGKHFLFNNINLGEILQNTCKVHCTLACGITADIKVGVKNSYSILKYNNKVRKIIYDKLPEEEYNTVPYYLLPIKGKCDFIGMKNGDGRNQALFNYILTLQNNDLSVEQCRQTITLINKYILSDPLDDRELNTILRDEAFDKPIFFNKNQFLFDKFAAYIRNNNSIVKINGQLHIYRNGVYENGYKIIESEMIKQIPQLNRYKRKEVLTYLDILIGGDSEASDAKYICFKNCVYNIEDNEVLPFSHDLIITNKINYNYTPGAYSEVVDSVLNKLACYDQDVRALLEEVIGYCFYRRNELRKAIVFLGGASGGKSTYLDMIKTLLGDKNTAALDLKELGDRFKTAELFGKLANIGDDIGDDFIANPAVFKKLTSGDRLNAERKGQDPFDFNNYAKLLFSANNMPRIKDKSRAVIDRLIIVPFDAVFSKDDPDYDPYIKYKLHEDECMEYLIQIGLTGLKRVLERKQFTVPESAKKALLEYEELNNPVLLFFKEFTDQIDGETTGNVYKEYTDFCICNNFTAMSKIEFSRQVKKQFNMDIKVKKVGNRTVRVFVAC